MGAPESEYAQWLATNRPKYPPFKDATVTSRELLRCGAAALTGDERNLRAVAKHFTWDKEHLAQVSSNQEKLTAEEKASLLALNSMSQQLWILYYSKRAARGEGLFS